MQQIIIFEGNTHQIQQEANDFLKQNPNVKVADTKINPMWDFYAGYPEQIICNQWTALTLVYEENENGL